MADYLIGIDAGTTNVKAGLFLTSGELFSQGSSGYETFVPGKLMAEQKPADWWNAAVHAITHMLEGVFDKDKDRILSVSVSSQAPSLTAMSKDGTILRDALIWMDRRAEKEMEEILELVGRERFTQITGAAPDSFYLLPKLYWYKMHEPQLYGQTDCILQTNGYINYCLTGEKSYDISHALLSLCVDVKRRAFSKEISEAVGIDFEKILPPISKNESVIGYVTHDASEITLIPEGTPVTAGTTDTIASLLSFGICSPNDAAEITGTSTLAFFAHGGKLTNPGKLMLKQSPISTIPTILNAPINATGASVRWFLDNFGMEKEAQMTGQDAYTLFTQSAKRAAPGSGGVLYFPYLMGERGPLWNTYARGMFIGMTLQTSRDDLARAVLEGTAYALRHLMEEAKKLGAEPESIRVSGGGSKNQLWLKIKASILKIPVLVPDEKCGNAILGDALLAGKAAGVYEDLGKTSREIVQIKKVIEPDSEWAAVYDRMYPYYRKLYEDLDEDLCQMAGVMKEIQKNQHLE